jgi:C2 domain
MVSYAGVPEQTQLSMQVQLYISCRKLKDLDVFSKSDPQVRIYEFIPQLNNWRMIAKTETISNNLNPDFKASIVLGYAFEQI